MGVAFRTTGRAIAGSSSDRRAVPAWSGVAIAVCTVSVATVAISLGSRVPAALSVATMVPAAAIDVRDRRLPDGWVAAAGSMLLVGTAVSLAFGAGTAPGPLAVGMAAGLLATAGPLLALHLVSPAAMGFGDVKGAVVLGAAVGTVDWRLGLVTLTVAAAAGAVTGLSRRSSTIAFGPFLVAGAVVALVGQSMWLGELVDGGAR